MASNKVFSILAGFVLLFFVYHFPEFFTAFWIMAVFKIGFLLVAFFLAKLQHFKGLRGYGLGLDRGWAAHLLAGVLLGAFFFLLSVFVSTGLHYQQITTIISFKNALAQMPMILLMTAIPSIAEDILTRGYLFAHLKFLHPIIWIVLSSVVYVLNHIWRLDDGVAVLSYLFLLGLVLAAAVWISKNLWLAFGIHWGANIAFESSHTIFQTKSLVANDAATWLLAGAWALLLVVIIFYGRFRLQYLRSKTGKIV